MNQGVAMQAHHHVHHRRREGGLSSSRWQPPARAARPSSRPAADSNAPDSSSSARSTSASNEAASGAGGRRWGGHGKENNRERHHLAGGKFGDARGSDRGHHRPSRPQRPAKKVVAPDEPTSAGAPSHSSAAAGAATDEAAIPRLDPNDPVHARRLRQRRRQLLFGKNTAGYEEYTKKIPRHRRRIRSPDCPVTPDHTLDIPTKRWQGLVNAWRRGLHRYDPPDLHLRQPAQDTITLAPRPCATEEDRQHEEIALAKAAGLQVAFGSMNVGGKMAGLFSTEVGGEEPAPTEGALEGATGKMEEEAPFAEEAAYRRANEEAQGAGAFLEEGCDEDSDDDIL